MDKRAVFNHYSHMLDTMLETNLFWNYYFQDPFCLDEDNIENLCFDFDWALHCGATRVCLEDKAYDTVVKIDLANFNACEAEVGTYDVACELGLEKYFTEPIFLGTYVKTIKFYDMEPIERALNYEVDYDRFENDFMENEEYFGELHDIVISLPLYAYPRATVHNYNPIYNKLSESQISEYEAAAKRHYSPLKERNLAIAIEFVKQYGEEEYERLSDFLASENVNDLHANNFGDIEGHFVIIDFAGYHNDYEEEEEE